MQEERVRGGMMRARELTFAVVAVLLACSACASGDDLEVDPVVTYEAYGQAFEPAPALPVQVVLAELDRHAGGPVMVEGVLRDECSEEDCWMVMTADTARLIISPPAFEVPSSAEGRRAVVHGVLSTESGGHVLEPTGVMIEDVRS